MSGSNDTVTFTGGFLENTNETFHPTVRYRRFCSRNAKLGYNEFYPYAPEALDKDWEWPPTRNNQGSATAPGQSNYSLNRKEDNGTLQKKSYSESAMTRLEQIYLAFYDQDSFFQITGEEKIYKQIFGSV